MTGLILLSGVLLMPLSAGAQTLPNSRQWSVPVAAPPLVAPVISGSVIAVALRPGTLVGHALADGKPLWTLDVAVDRGMTADDERVYVTSEGQLVAVDAGTGRVAWRAPLGGPATAPPLARAGWVIVTEGSEVIGIRASDGGVVWRKGVGPVAFRPALDGDLLVLSITDGLVVGLNVETGEQRWSRALGAEPTAPTLAGDRIYVGTANKAFITLLASSGRIESTLMVGAMPRGAAAVDERHVYFTALDNVLYATDRADGGREWHKGLPYRPIDGPVVLGDAVVVPGYVPTLPAYQVRAGGSAGQLEFEARLAAPPVFGKTPQGTPVAVGVTGGENNKLALTLLAPSLVPPLPMPPLTELPGTVMPLPVPPVL